MLGYINNNHTILSSSPHESQTADKYFHPLHHPLPWSYYCRLRSSATKLSKPLCHHGQTNRPMSGCLGFRYEKNW